MSFSNIYFQSNLIDMYAYKVSTESAFANMTELVIDDDELAVYKYRKAAFRGDAVAQKAFGDCYFYGRVFPKNFERAAFWYRKAAVQGNCVAQQVLADCYVRGEGVPKDHTLAFWWYNKAAEQGSALAQEALGHCYAEGRGVRKDRAQAALWYEKAAEQGYADAQLDLARCYLSGAGVSIDGEQALNWLLKAAETGNLSAWLLLAYSYKLGIRVPKNDEHAHFWFKKLAEKEVPLAQDELFLCYSKGVGVAADEEKALYYLQKAAENGYRKSQLQLGLIFEEKSEDLSVFWYTRAAESGSLVAQQALIKHYLNNPNKKEELLLWRTKAAEQGDVEAQFALANHYLDCKEAERSLYWMTKAAEAGNVASQTGVGAFLVNGIGGPVDNEKGVAWLKKAAEKGSATAQFELGEYYFWGKNGEPIDKIGGGGWYLKAADQFHKEGLANAGFCFLYGEGLPKDEELGIRYLKLAIEKGSDKAQFFLQIYLEFAKKGIPKKINLESLLEILIEIQNIQTVKLREWEEEEKAFFNQCREEMEYQKKRCEGDLIENERITAAFRKKIKSLEKFQKRKRAEKLSFFESVRKEAEDALKNTYLNQKRVTKRCRQLREIKASLESSSPLDSTFGDFKRSLIGDLTNAIEESEKIARVKKESLEMVEFLELEQEKKLEKITQKALVKLEEEKHRNKREAIEATQSTIAGIKKKILTQPVVEDGGLFTKELKEDLEFISDTLSDKLNASHYPDLSEELKAKDKRIKELEKTLELIDRSFVERQEVMRLESQAKLVELESILEVFSEKLDRLQEQIQPSKQEIEHWSQHFETNRNLAISLASVDTPFREIDRNKLLGLLQGEIKRESDLLKILDCLEFTPCHRKGSHRLYKRSNPHSKPLYVLLSGHGKNPEARIESKVEVMKMVISILNG